mgnify:CR=1 FL=1
MNPKYLVVAMWNGKVKNHCAAENPADAVTHFTDACKGLFNRSPTEEEVKNGLVSDRDRYLHECCSVQVLCLEVAGVLVTEEDEEN